MRRKKPHGPEDVRERQKFWLIFQILRKGVLTYRLRMRFVLESVSEQGVRMGKIFWGACGNSPTHPAIGTTVGEAFTPLCLLYTRGGSIPHLTPDIVQGLVAKLDGGSNGGRSARKMAILTLPTVYVCIYTCLYGHIYTCLYCICTCLYVHIYYTCVYVHIYTCIYV